MRRKTARRSTRRAGRFFPAATQKYVKPWLFDPLGRLFPRGAHMPFLVFLGIKPRRIPEAIQRREVFARIRQSNARAKAPNPVRRAVLGLASGHNPCPSWRDAPITRDCERGQRRGVQAAAQGGDWSEGARGQWDSLRIWDQPDLDDS